MMWFKYDYKLEIRQENYVVLVGKSVLTCCASMQHLHMCRYGLQVEQLIQFLPNSNIIMWFSSSSSF